MSGVMSVIIVPCLNQTVGLLHPHLKVLQHVIDYIKGMRAGLKACFIVSAAPKLLYMVQFCARVYDNIY